MRSLFLILFFMMQASSLWAEQERQKQPFDDTKEFCQQRIDEALVDIKNNNYTAALQNLLQAELMANANNWPELSLNINLNLGNVYYYLSDYGQALDYYREALHIAQNNKELREKSARPLQNIGLIYAKEKNYKKALEYYSKVFELVENKKDGSLRKHAVMSMAQVYLELNQVEKAITILNESKEEVDDEQINFMWKAVYAKTLLANNQTAKAENLANQLYNEVWEKDFKNKDLCYFCITGIMSEIYKELHDPNRAISYAEEALLYTNKLKDKEYIYGELSKLYIHKSDFQKALLYTDTLVITKDSILNSKSKGLYEASKVRLGIQEYQYELFKEKERKKVQNYIYLGVVLGFLIIFFSIYRKLKRREAQQKQLARITVLELEKEKKEHLLAEEKLKREVADKNRELTAKALYSANRNQTIQEIVNSIENNIKFSENKETQQQLNIIKSFLKTDEQRDDFMRHFESVNPIFISRLKNKHPKLTSNDIRFLSYIFMNLNLKEISTIFNITYDASVFRKRRIIKKLGIDKNKISLYDYLLSITN